MRLSFFTIIFILLNSLCYAESSNKKSTGMGVGIVKCYELIDKSKDYFMRNHMFLSWAQGYMSAVNAYTAMDVDLNTIDTEEQLVIMKDFCEKNKRSLVVESVEYLMMELNKQQGKGDK